MQTLAMGCQLAFSGRLVSARALVALARLPAESVLPLLLHATALVIVLWVGCPPLSIHPALQAADGLGVRGQFLTEDRMTRLACSWDQRDRRWSQVRSDDVVAHGVLLLAMRDSFQRELHPIAKPSCIRPRGTLTAGTVLHQAGIFDALSESMGDHLIFPIDHGFQLVILPDQKAAIALLWLLQHETQSGIVAFVLQAPQSSSPALEADAACFSHTDAVEGLIGARGQGLGQHRIQMVGNPADARRFGILVQGVFREAIALSQGGSHLAQTALSFGKHGIVEGSPSLQMPPDAFGLPLIHDQGQFQQHRGRFAP